jgi:hypothetical protein
VPVYGTTGSLRQFLIPLFEEFIMRSPGRKNRYVKLLESENSKGQTAPQRTIDLGGGLVVVDYSPQIGLDKDWERYPEDLKEKHWYDHSKDFPELDALYRKTLAAWKSSDAPTFIPKPKGPRETISNTTRYFMAPGTSTLYGGRKK